MASREKRTDRIASASPVPPSPSSKEALMEAMPQMEFTSDGAMKRLFRVVYSSVLIGAGLLAALVAMNLSESFDVADRTLPVAILGSVVGAMDTAVLTVCVAASLVRLRAVGAAGLAWSLRRWRWMSIFLMQLGCVWVGSVFFFVPNLRVATRRCWFFDPMLKYSWMVRWTAWNTYLALALVHARSFTFSGAVAGVSAGGLCKDCVVGVRSFMATLCGAYVAESPSLKLASKDIAGPLDIAGDGGGSVARLAACAMGGCPGHGGVCKDEMLADAPWRVHWIVGVYWCLFQGCVLRFVPFVVENEAPCSRTVTDCSPPPPIMVAISLMVTFECGYLFLFLYFMRRAFVQLAARSYVQHRWTNISLRFTFRTVGIVLLLGVLSISLLGFARRGSCMSYLMAVAGYVPMHPALALLMAVNTAMALPIGPECERPTQAPPSGPVWLERHVKEQRQGRNVNEAVDWDQSFCFERAVKLIYWCEFVYEYDPKTGQQASSPFDIETGMALFGLNHCEYVQASGMDANAIVAWSESGTILLCFRGTYSATNVVADLKVWRARHPPMRGHLWLGTCPLVHKGFLQSWAGEGFGNRVLSRVRAILRNPDFDAWNLNVLVTGHSLGGAMAVLAANDIARYCNVAQGQLSCYTFGCPRVGNRAFAAEHDARVPDTWHIVNDLDPVPRMAKFWTLYKRTGNRVVVNDRGDIIVSPSFLEFKLTSAFMGKRRIVHHKLSSYRKSLSSVVGAQLQVHKVLAKGNDPLSAWWNDGGDIAKVLLSGRGSDHSQ